MENQKITVSPVNFDLGLTLVEGNELIEVLESLDNKNEYLNAVYDRLMEIVAIIEGH